MHLKILAFFIGILSCQLLTALPTLHWSWLIIPLLVLLRWLPRLQWILLAGIGFLWFSWQANLILSQALPNFAEEEVVIITGQISGLPYYDERRWQFKLKTITLEGEKYKTAYTGMVRLVWITDEPFMLHPGQQWQFRVKLNRRRGFLNPSLFDYSRWLFQQRIQATGYVLKTSQPIQLTQSNELSLDSWRFQLAEQLRQILADKPTQGLLMALAIGERQDISEAQWQLLRDTGIAHLMAISGLHIGLVAFLSFGISFWIWSSIKPAVLWIPAPRIAALSAVSMALLYAALAGFAIPTQRALIMVFVAVLGTLLARQIAPLHMLTWALLLVLLWDPLAVMSYGFWLSFGAVAILLFVFSGRRHKGHFKLSLLNWLRSFSQAQIALILGLLPFSLYFFGYVPVNSFLANLLAIPTVSFIVVPLTLLGVLSLNLSTTLAVYLLSWADFVLAIVLSAVQILADFEWAVWRPPKPPLWTVMIAWVGVFIVLLPRGFAGRWLGIIWLLPLFFVPLATPRMGEVWLTVLDVGQGLAVVIRTQHHTLLYDTGVRSRSGFDTGKRVVVPYLQAQGIDELDTLLVSHDDIDHIGGAASVLEAIKVKQILTSAPQAFAQFPQVTRCEIGQTWQWEGVSFKILHPPQPYIVSDNDLSCVLQIQTGEVSVLLTGDITARSEYRLAEVFGTELRSTLLLVPHHGSRTSSSELFLDLVHPKIALLSAGYKNRFGLPRSEVIARYQARQILVYNTAQAGAISVYLSPTQIEAIDLTREKFRRFWH